MVVFCFTGKAPKPRKEMEAIAIKAGASVTKSITSKTTILVIADKLSNSLKARKARQADILLINPKQFFKMCDDASAITYSPVEEESFLLGPFPQHKTRRQKRRAKSSDKKKKHSSTRRIEL